MTILHTMTNDKGRRLDRVLRKALPGLPLSLIHRYLREGTVLVDGRPRHGDFRLNEGQTISVPGEAAGEAPPPAAAGPGGAGRLLGLQAVWENKDLLAVNKEAGVEVHGRRCRGADSLDTLVQAYLGPKLPPSLSFRPGPLHRLDKPTSGIVVFSVSLEGAQRFSRLLREGSIHKQYLAIVEGRIAGPGLWEEKLLRDREARKTFTADEGKIACTRYTPLARGTYQGRDFTLLVLEPQTGRTHQIRVQAAFHGHPLAGDTKYGGRILPSPPRQAVTLPQKRSPRPNFLLHAWKLETAADDAKGSGLLPPALEAPLPDYFEEYIKEIFGLPFLRLCATLAT
jgi:23S rRNA pseudouridine955/2504/2580 synthase